MTTERRERRAPALAEMRRMFEGVVPPAMCSVAADGTPHVTYLSHAEYVDAEHLALTFQFFNRSRQNVLATQRIALMVDDPYTGAGVVLQMRYLRTETEGPVFERLRAKLAGIAAQTGMEGVFKLRGADIYRVESLRVIDDGTLPGLEPRCDLASGARALSQALADCATAEALVATLMEGLAAQLRIEHAILWMRDEARGTLYTLASRGYASGGTGAELTLEDAGLAGVAVREGVPIRIGHMTQMYRYGMAAREQLKALGLEEMARREIPLPGLATPRSQLAVPLRRRGKAVGALLVESDRDQFFSYDDEDALALIANQFAAAIAALAADEPEPPAAAAPMTAPQGAPLRLKRFARDDSVFLDDDYLIKGVAGAILWKIAGDYAERGRVEFSTRELRLAGEALRLPDVQDNLGVRLLLLQRRLEERGVPLRIERTGRGRFRFVCERPLVLEVAG
jgi:adenylate cyclase